MPRKRRKPRPTVAHYAAPVAFLLGVTIAVLLVHSALTNGGKTTTTSLGPVTTVATGSTPTPPAAGAKKKFYIVQTGDTFGTIADKQGISLEQLQALNPGTSSNALQVGQKLRIK